MSPQVASRAARRRSLRRWWEHGLLALLVLVAASPLRAQDTITFFNPVMNGTVNAIAYGNGVTYLGGSFSSVSFDSGSMARIDQTTGLPDPNFPQVTNGLVDHILADGNGGWYISGEFTTVAGVTRNHIAHILPNETLDPSFDPDADGRVYNLKLVGTTLYCAGMFSNIGGAARGHLAAIDATTGLATSWNPGTFNGTIIWGLDLNGTAIYVGGDFTKITSPTGVATTRDELACISATDGSVSSWNPSANSTVYWITYNPADGNIYAGGAFTRIGTTTRNYCACINSTGALTSWNPNMNGAVWHMIVNASNVLFAAGDFTTVGGQSHPYVAAFNVATANTGTPYAWNPKANGIVWWTQPIGDTLYCGGQFTSIGNASRSYIGAVDITNVNTATSNATAWAPAASAQVYTLTDDSTSILAGGPFTAVASSRANVVAVNSESGAVLPWNPGITGTVQALALATTGSTTTLYIGGSITKIGTTTVTGLGAVDATTGTPSSWAPVLSGGTVAVNALCVANGVLYAGGTFTTVAPSTTRNHAAAWNIPAGSLANWNPNCNNTVSALAATVDGIAVGGQFTQLGGATCNYLGMTTADTGASVAITGSPNAAVSALYATSSMLYAGGTFTKVGTAARTYAAAWDLQGLGLDATWQPAITGSSVQAIAGYLGELFLGGSFAKVGGVAAANLASVDPQTGAANASFVPAPSATVTSLLATTAAPQFRLYVGGAFTTIAGVSRAEAASFDLDHAPTAVALSASSVVNDSPNGTVVGTLSTTDADPTDTFVYTLANSAGGLFGISGNELVIANQAVFTDPPPATYTITAISTDADGQSCSQSFVLGVTVVKQVPTITWAAPAAITYGTALGAAQLNASASIPGTFSYSPPAGTVLAAGSHQLTCTFTPQDTGDYSSTNASVTLVVQPAPLTVTANNASRVYNTPNPTFTASYSGLVNGDTPAQLGGSLVCSCTATQSSPLGAYPITPSGLTSPNYAITFAPGTLTIAVSAPTISWAAPAAIPYGTTLSALQLDATATANGSTVPGTFSYTPAAGTALHAGTGLTLSVTFTPTDQVDYTSATAEQSITVTQAPLTITANAASMTYGAGSLPGFSASYAGFVNHDTASSLGGSPGFSTSATGGSIVGSYAVQPSHGTITDLDYAYTYASGTLTITPATLTVAASNGAFTYGGTVPTLSATITGYVNGDTSAVVSGTPALATTATSASAVGSYPITVTAGTLQTNANYTFAYSNGAMSVTRALLTVTPGNATKVYGAALPAFTDTITGFVNHDTVSVVSGTASLTTTATTASGVGSYPVTASLGTLSAANYSFAFAGPATLSVTSAPLTVAATSGSKLYGAALPSPLPYAFTGLVNGDGPGVVTGVPAETCTASATSPVGSYTCQVTSAAGLSAANYAIAFSNATQPFTVLRAPLTVRAWDCAMVQGAATLPHLAPTYAGFVLGDTASVVSGTATCSTTASSTSPIGAYSVTTTGSLVAANYAIAYGTGTLAVVGAPSRISASASGAQLLGSSVLNGLSADGSIALITSNASTLPGNAAGNDRLYLMTTSSTPPAITPVPDAIAGEGSLSGDGQHVAYIAPEGTLWSSFFQIKLWTVGNASASIESNTSAGVPANGDCLAPLVSDDGLVVAFETEAVNLSGATNGNPNQNCDIIYRNRSLATPTDIVISALQGGVAGTADCALCALSPDGRYCAFTSTSTTLGGAHSVNATYPYNAFLYDGWNNTLTRVDLTATGGQPDAGCGYRMAFSSDDKYLVFSSFASNLVAPTLPTQCENVYLYPIAAGSSGLIRVSANENGVLPGLGCYAPQISGDGHYVAFLADDGSFEANDTNSATDVYIASLFQNGTVGAPIAINRLSVTSASGLVNDDVLYEFWLSRDATRIAYYTFANNCVAGDTNGDSDVFEQATMVPAGADPPPTVPTPPNGDG